VTDRGAEIRIVSAPIRAVGRRARRSVVPMTVNVLSRITMLIGAY
jgi:hypothetical protein